MVCFCFFVKKYFFFFCLMLFVLDFLRLCGQKKICPFRYLMLSFRMQSPESTAEHQFFFRKFMAQFFMDHLKNSILQNWKRIQCCCFSFFFLVLCYQNITKKKKEKSKQTNQWRKPLIWFLGCFKTMKPFVKSKKTIDFQKFQRSHYWNVRHFQRYQSIETHTHLRKKMSLVAIEMHNNRRLCESNFLQAEMSGQGALRWT